MSHCQPIDDLRAAIAKLNLEQAQLLQCDLETLIEQLQVKPFQEPTVVKANLVVQEVRHIEGVTYQLERVKCGKEGCKCTEAPIHGPYWYAYWRVNDRQKTRYIGKRFKTIDVFERLNLGGSSQ
ncbi:DUF6788 family protein [Iningainema tapete]|uniref:DUF6788 domain-containing protein n=1 Tax=Iningainema tapete BLCC-T55 TaxID=2748662 RepID=A0A8J6XIU8_9CYAN|nr:DUF6788 family protein [Iningainema tapete]MBD2773216.1 hypothetical protein [Iningainema tapete BLCC-T55]